MEIKNKPLPSFVTDVPTTKVGVRIGGAIDLGGIPDVSDQALHAVLRRSKCASRAHDDIVAKVADGGRLGRKDLEGMLERAGVETTDVKTVLAYHAKHSTGAFDEGALRFLSTLDFSDVAAAHVEELKRQNKEQVQSHQQFIKTDKREHEQIKGDDAKALQKKTAEQEKLKAQTPFEADADFAAEITKSGVTDPKQAALLQFHRKRFTNNT